MERCDTTALAVTGIRVPERATGAGMPRRARASLLPPLRAVVRELAASGIDTGIRVAGPARDLDPLAVDALVGAARAAAADAVTGGRALVVALTVTFEPGRVAVVVRDDGTDPAARPESPAAACAARRLAALGGRLEISHGRPTGAVVRAWVT